MNLENRPSNVLFVFIDGIGLGDPSARSNPLAQLKLPALERLARGQSWTSMAEPFCKPDHVFRALNASLGVPGLPQSGTGQATLLTGFNCAEIAGRHFGPFPHSKTRPILAEHNIFRQIQGLNLPFPEPVAFANAYPPPFFAAVRERDRWTVTTRCCLDAGVPIRDHVAFARGDALAADITGTGWKGIPGLDVHALTEEEAADRLVRITRRHAFTLFEYFLTDKAGHSQSFERAHRVLASLDRFLAALLDSLPPDVLLLITSDHGNIEDLSTKSHTLNPVPFAACGSGAANFCTAGDLSDITPAILDVLYKPALER